MGQIQTEIGPFEIAGDAPTPQELQGLATVIQQRRGQPAAPQPGQFGGGMAASALGPGRQTLPMNSTLGDVVQSIGSGIARGGASIAGTPGALMQLSRQGARVLLDPILNATMGNSPEQMAWRDEWTRGEGPAGRGLPPTPPQILQSAQAAGMPLHEPTTGPGRYAQDMTEGATAMALGPARALPWMFGLGAAAGGASRATEDMTSRMAPDSLARQYGPEVARLVTTLVGGIPAARRGAVGDILERRMAGITPADTQRATDLAAEGRRMRVPLSPVEALGPAGAQMQNLASDIMATPQGAPMAQALASRQPQVVNAVRGPGGVLERISPDASTEAPMQARSAASTPLYRQAAMEPLDPAAVNTGGPSLPVVLGPVIRDVQQAAREAGTNNPLGRQLTAYERSISTPEPGETTMRVGPLQTAYQNMRDNVLPSAESMGEAERAALSARLRGAAAGPNAALGQTLEAASPNFAEAQTRFRAMSPRVEAAQTRQDLLDTLNTALNAGSVNPRNPTVGARFAHEARGREGGTTREAFDERIRQAALARGLNPDAMVADLNRSMDVLAETGSIPGIGSRTASRGGLREEARANPVADTASLVRTLTGGGAFDMMRNASERATYGRLSGMLMPGADIAALNAARGVGVGPRQGALAARLLSVLQAPGNLPEQGR